MGQLSRCCTAGALQTRVCPIFSGMIMPYLINRIAEASSQQNGHPASLSRRLRRLLGGRFASVADPPDTTLERSQGPGTGIRTHLGMNEYPGCAGLCGLALDTRRRSLETTAKLLADFIARLRQTPTPRTFVNSIMDHISILSSQTRRWYRPSVFSCLSLGQGPTGSLKECSVTSTKPALIMPAFISSAVFRLFPNLAEDSKPNC